MATAPMDRNSEHARPPPSRDHQPGTHWFLPTCQGASHLGGWAFRTHLAAAEDTCMNDSLDEVPEHAFGLLLGLEGTVYREAATSPNLGTELQVHDQGVLECTYFRIFPGFFWVYQGRRSPLSHQPHVKSAQGKCGTEIPW